MNQLRLEFSRIASGFLSLALNADPMRIKLPRVGEREVGSKCMKRNNSGSSLVVSRIRCDDRTELYISLLHLSTFVAR